MYMNINSDLEDSSDVKIISYDLNEEKKNWKKNMKKIVIEKKLKNFII